MPPNEILIQASKSVSFHPELLADRLREQARSHRGYGGVIIFLNTTD
jgi:hypothetical protein